MKIKIIRIILSVIVSTLLVWGFYLLALEWLADPQLNKLFNAIVDFKIYSSKSFDITVGSILLSLFLIAISVKVSKVLSEKIVTSVLKKFNVSEGATATVQTLSFYLFLTTFVILAFSVSKIPLTVFTLFGGALAIGVGFGSQSIVSNFISGIIIQIERPMKVGDIICLENAKTGKITEIGARSTKILTAENTHVVVPNSHFLDRQFINMTLTNHIVRASVNLSFAPGQDPKIIKMVLLDCMKKLEGVMVTPVPEVYFMDITENSLKFSLYFWVYLNREKGRVEQESALREIVFEDCVREKIEFAKPLLIAKLD